MRKTLLLQYANAIFWRKKMLILLTLKTITETCFFQYSSELQKLTSPPHFNIKHGLTAVQFPKCTHRCLCFISEVMRSMICWYILFSICDGCGDDCYLMQRSDDFTRLLVDDLWPPVRVETSQVSGHSVVFSHPERVKGRQGQNLIDSGVSSHETLHPFTLGWPGLLEAWGRTAGDRRKVRSTVIAVFSIDSQRAFGAGEISQGFFQRLWMTVDGGRVYEWSDRIHLLTLKCVSWVEPMNVWAGG